MYNIHSCIDNLTPHRYEKQLFSRAKNESRHQCQALGFPWFSAARSREHLGCRSGLFGQMLFFLKVPGSDPTNACTAVSNSYPTRQLQVQLAPIYYPYPLLYLRLKPKNLESSRSMYEPILQLMCLLSGHAIDVSFHAASIAA